MIKASDLVSTEFDRSSQESAYRRGFVQGVAETIRLVESKKSISDLQEWIDCKLSAWRQSNHNGSMQPPPELR
jgi:hypothetical protein